MSSDGNNPSYPLQISATVGGPPPTVGVEPATVDFDRFAADAPQTATVKLSNYTPNPLHVKILEEPFDFLSASLSGTTIQPRESVDLTIATTKTPPLGRFHSGVTLELDEANATRLTVPISGITMMR